ncbi:hypothetical protein FH972_004363 [Carpinus fangiana]|uniref:Uncharacterized protein n=1 Tax=Carpinus fangiana TaxID=176857 RepID=A0A5N6QNE0_9ROSI|nr:hypothetical protein FH972_004363 [Carpinus fangiana]
MKVTVANGKQQTCSFYIICFFKTYAYVGLNIQKERRVEEREEVSIRHPKKKKNIEMVHSNGRFMVQKQQVKKERKTHSRIIVTPMMFSENWGEVGMGTKTKANHTRKIANGQSILIIVVDDLVIRGHTVNWGQSKIPRY